MPQQCVFSLYYPSGHICSPQCGHNLTHTYTQNSTHTGREGTVEIGINCVKTLERVGIDVHISVYPSVLSRMKLLVNIS